MMLTALPDEEHPSHEDGASAPKHKTIKISAAARQKLGLIASAMGMPMTAVIDQMTNQWWAKVVEGGWLPPSGASQSRGSVGVNDWEDC